MKREVRICGEGLEIRLQKDTFLLPFSPEWGRAMKIYGTTSHEKEEEEFSFLHI